MTRIGVRAAPGRARLDLHDGALSPRVIRSDSTGVRVCLVATTALLLGGDHVVVDIDVGPSAWLHVEENAGTVAYDAGGQPSSWTVRATVAAGGTLTWFGQPMVVAAGANVTRLLDLRLAPGAAAVLRDILVLGRSGEQGGGVRARQRVHHDGAALQIEDLDLTDPTRRARPGMMGGHRVIDTVAAYGLAPTPGCPPPPARRFDLAGPGVLVRWLADNTGDPAPATLVRTWARQLRGTRGAA